MPGQRTERIGSPITTVVFAALLTLGFASLGCGSSRRVYQPPDCPEPSSAAITITSPKDNEVVTTNSVEIEFTVTGYKLAEPQDCDGCKDCGHVTVEGPRAASFCGVPPPTTISSPVTVPIRQFGGECPVVTLPGLATLKLSLYSALKDPPVYDEVTIDFQPSN